MSRGSSVQALIESTLSQLEYELESEGAEYDFIPAAIPAYRWSVYTNDRDSAQDPWRLHRRISARNMDRGKLRSFEADCLHRLAPSAGPMATQIAIQRCKWDGQQYVAEACRTLELRPGGGISTCTHPRPPADC